MHDKGDHPCLSEDWLIDNLPTGWDYDCHTGEQPGFIIYRHADLGENDGMGYPADKVLFIPLDLLKIDRTKP